ncbi:hypothetical protein F5888DRAFT_1635772 [Russula emetica]|nr:hypothetical protein F5888DRAFT_1635772 [Russula emetica]
MSHVSRYQGNLVTGMGINVFLSNYYTDTLRDRLEVYERTHLLLTEERCKEASRCQRVRRVVRAVQPVLQKGIIGKAKIQCIPIASDDGLGGVEMPGGYQWQDRYTHSPTRRISRVEVVTQVHLSHHFTLGHHHMKNCLNRTLLMIFFVSRHERLEASTKDSKVAGFKSVACRRPELGVSAVPNPAAETAALFRFF